MSSKDNNWDNEFTTRELSLREIQEEELKILISFDSFCKRHNLMYSLAGGTLLGAVRHKGFIPWDDDIDVSLSRIDYKKLLDLKDAFEKETNLEFFSHLVDDLTIAPFIKIINPSIFVSSQLETSAPRNLWIDVTPVDGVPESVQEIEKLFFSMKCYRFLLSVYTAKFNASVKLFNNIVRTICKPLVVFPIFKKLLCKVITRQAKRIGYGDTNLVAAISWGIYGTKEVLPFKGYESKVKIEFEGRSFCAMSCWDMYLSQLYGDYMKIPPKNFRKTHSITAWISKDK